MRMRFLFLLIFSSLFFGCIRRSPEPILYTAYKPILMSREVFKNKITMSSSKPIGIAAKIYYKDNFIYISESQKGVHIIDNTDPTKPVNKRFISIQGCIDVAIKNNVMYADNVVDLIAIDLLEAEKGVVKVLKRIENVFPEPSPPDNLSIPDKYSVKKRTPNTFIIGWEK